MNCPRPALPIDSACSAQAGSRLPHRVWTTISAFLLAIALAVVGSTAARAAVEFQLGENGITIKNGDSVKLTLAYPVLVNSAKTKMKISEKSVSEKTATLKFEGGGQLAVEIGSGDLVLKPSNVPAGTQFISSSMHIDAGYIGGKWSAGTSQETFPSEKAAKGNLYQGNAASFSVTNPAGITTALTLPDNT